MIRALTSCAEVTVLSLVHDDEEAGHTADVRRFVHRVSTARVPAWRNKAKAALSLPTSRPLTLELLSAPSVHRRLRELVRDQPPDLVFAYCSSMVRYAMEPPLEGIPFVLDMVDLDSEKWRTLSRSTAWPRRLIYKREARCLARFEATAVRASRTTLAVNRKEADAVRRLAPEADIRVVGNGVDIEGFAPPDRPSGKAQVVFCGVLNYGPNEEAVLRLARDIWPMVLETRPDARLLIVGAHPTASIQALAQRDPSITVTGEVPDVRPFLWESAIAAVPLRTARGLQNKVLEALASGLPAVVSGVVAEGLPDFALAGCAVADTDQDFARIIGDWLGQPADARREIARRARLETLTWQEQLRPLCGIAREAASVGQRHASC